MNCPSRNDDTEDHPTWNQSPSALASGLTTRADFNGIINLRNRDEQEQKGVRLDDERIQPESEESESNSKGATAASGPMVASSKARRSTWYARSGRRVKRQLLRAREVLFKYAQFVGPGFMIAVAYIDPGNYATDVAAGASTQYKLLFIVLLSNLIAIFLQSLCIKLGSVTGYNLAENCRRHLPRWLNYVLYVFAEAAIVATDIAEVIGSAIALNLLLHIPLVGGVAITIVDVLLLLLFWKPDGSMTRLRVFEYFVAALVFGVMICFCIQLSYLRNTSAGDVFRGYLPSSAIVKGSGIYQSCGIIGATVMPHSLFLGSGIVQPRIRQFDDQRAIEQPSSTPTNSESSPTDRYHPAPHVIRTCIKYSIVELTTSLFTIALFVNSAILIVAGSSLYHNNNQNASPDLFGIHDLLSRNLAPAAGTVFALALLLSGTSAGIVCTMAGQMVSEGMLDWKVRPWVRRLVTRTISIIPSIIIAGAVGKEGLGKALTASQVVLSVILPFVSAPLVWFTCRGKIMSVVVVGDRESSNGRDGGAENGDTGDDVTESGIRENGRATETIVNMRNGRVVAALAAVIWLMLVVMNGALLVLVGLGKS